MKLKISQDRLKVVAQIGILLTTMVIAFFLLPRNEHFRYHFDAGKPWGYGLLTAPADFPIKKTDEQVKREQDSVIHYYYTPYYRVDASVSNERLALLEQDENIEENTKILIINVLKDLYAQGVLSTEEREKVTKSEALGISIIGDGNKSVVIPLDQVLTIKVVYERLTKLVPGLTIERARVMGLSQYIVGNLKFEEGLSEQAYQELLGSVMLSEGSVLKGERIIDTGEIVDEHTFNVLLSLKEYSQEQSISKRKEYLMMFGELLFVLVLILSLAAYLKVFRQKFTDEMKNLIFFMLSVLCIIALAFIVTSFTKLSIYLIPFTLLPIIVRIFFDSRTALFTHIITILIVSVMSPYPIEFLLLQIPAGMSAVSSLKNLTQRVQLIQTAALIFVTYAVMYTAYTLMIDGSFTAIKPLKYAYFAISSALALFAYALIYIVEKLFGFLSDLTLVELSNVNSKLMLQFSEAAPGSFQHSLQVANLAAEAAKKINANMLLARTGALYHDIGKMKNPLIFTENQVGTNPLNEMNYEEAAQVIIAHVENGVKIAQKNNIPEQVIDFIRMHHGKGKVKYFYNSYKNKYPNKAINEEAFTYPGPLPNSKETAIVMMADAIEATAKSLTEHTEEAIDSMVERIIDGQIADGAFKNAPITFKYVEMVKEVFKEKLKSIYHVRIAYPEIKKTK